MSNRKIPVRVLHLEDNPRDGELIAHKLAADDGMAFDILRVDNAARFEAALAGAAYDVILCDCNIPGYDGFAALKLAQEKHPQVPVIIVSGSMGEEEVVNCLQLGAKDYLLKQRLDRFVPAVKRVLQEADGQRKRGHAEAALRESEERFRQLAEQSSEGFWFVSVNPERLTYASPAMERIWGLPVKELYQHPNAWKAAIHLDDQARVQEAWSACLKGDSSDFEAEYRLIRPDGSIRWVLDNGTPIRNDAAEIMRIGGVATDITGRKQVEGQMLRTQRLESIGTLAGGIAHDLNNALLPILMSTELLRMQCPDETEIIDTVAASARRAAAMVRQLLTFAKGIEGARLLVQSGALLYEMEKLMKGTFPKNIQLRIIVAKNLPVILGDATQLHQVLLNLCVNARDAMPHGGTLTLDAAHEEIDAIGAGAAPEARPGPYVVWRVSDTGSGIAPEILDRVFEPFFSTKGPDQGTGLGLSTVIGIVRSHGGFVRVCSSPGQGSTFAIYLPADGSSAANNSQPDKPGIAFRGNGETILVVDDEVAVRDITRAVLTALNFKVVTAADGTAALIQVAEKRAELAAVITDVNMPHMDGIYFVRVLKRMLPEARIIVTSGRFEEQQANELKLMGVVALLDKPFSQESLMEALQTIFRG